MWPLQAQGTVWQAPVESKLRPLTERTGRVLAALRQQVEAFLAPVTFSTMFSQRGALLMNKAQGTKAYVQNMDRAKVINSTSLLVIVIVAAILFILMIPAIQVGTWNDDATYVTMAQSLLQGKGLSLTYLPTDPVYPLVPIGYPLVLALFVFLFPNSFLPLQLLSSGFLLITVVLLYHHTRPRLGDGFALLIAALFATNVAIVQSAAQVMSEALFLLCLMCALLQTERFIKLQSVRWHHVLLTATVIGLPLSVRYLGLPVVAALMIYILWRRRDKSAVSTIVLSVVILLIINLGLGGLEVGQYYVDRFSGLVSRLNPLATTASVSGAASSETAGASWLTRVISNTRFVLTNPIPGLVVPLFGGPRIRALFDGIKLGFIPDCMQLGIDFLLIIGLIQQVRPKARAGEWVIFAYSASLFLLPTNWETLRSRFRYWIPLIPFGYVYLLTALQSIDRLIVQRIRLPGWLAHPNSLAVLGVACMLVLNLRRDGQESIFNPLRDRLPDLSVGSEWIQTHSDLDDVIMVQITRVFTLYLQREVIPYPCEYDSRLLYGNLPEWQEDPFAAETLFRIVDEFDVDCILISPAHEVDQPLHWTSCVQNTLLPVIHSRPDKFLLVWTSDDQFTQVYEVLK